jgi:anti-sigma28 factor (negative regulator of flagellin synthesis)
MKTQQQRAQALREQKLASIREQVEKGSLVIRQMTPEERASYGPRRGRPARR